MSEEKEPCQDCLCANVCTFYNDVHKAVAPYESRARFPMVCAKVAKCDFKKPPDEEAERP
jgi:hypothetical protein